MQKQHKNYITNKFISFIMTMILTCSKCRYFPKIYGSEWGRKNVITLISMQITRRCRVFKSTWHLFIWAHQLGRGTENYCFLEETVTSKILCHESQIFAKSRYIMKVRYNEFWALQSNLGTDVSSFCLKPEVLLFS